MTIAASEPALTLKDKSTVTVVENGLVSYEIIKRVVDVILSLIGILVTSSIMLIFAILVKLDSSGPILADTPKRVGKDGKLFKMYKFRSMVVGAFNILQKNPELFKKYKQNSFKLSIDEDPRITKIGKLIRKTSIDELPQLFNILKGEMSIVGPRAYYPFELEDQQKKYPQTKEFVRVILSAKPGLTGEWQTSGRSEINFDKRVAMDARYIHRRAIFYDFWLILKTIPVVLLRRGAI